MTVLPIYTAQPCQSPRALSMASSPRNSQSKWRPSLWFLAITLIAGMIAGFLSVDRLKLTSLNGAKVDASGMTLFLSENAIGSPAIGAPHEDGEALDHSDGMHRYSEGLVYGASSNVVRTVSQVWNSATSEEEETWSSQDYEEDDLIDATD